MRFFLWLCRVLVSAASLSAVVGVGASAAEEKPVRVLIIDGFSNHDWRVATARLQEILMRHGGFTCVVSTSPDAAAPAETLAAWAPPLEQADVVLLNCNDLGKPVRWSDAVRQALEQYVANGGGLYAFHSANNAFEEWREYNRMIGLGWRDKDFGVAVEIHDDEQIRRIPAGEGLRTSHGKRVDALVQRHGDHPVHRGLPRAWRAADIEVYTYARGPAENLEVLSYSKDNAPGKAFPIEWVVNYGKGHVYSSTFGHLWTGDENPPAFRCAAFQTLLVRTLRWLAGRDVGAEVPGDFPSAAAISLRER
jgi:uncharacterized protein